MHVNQPNSTTPLHPGDKLDKYEIVGQAGAGGMSIVWKGHDRLLDRHVAIKQLRSSADADQDEQLRERFLKEAQIQKRLSSNQKYLVKVIDFIAESRGLFIVMEFVDGPSLEQLLSTSTGPLDERQALGIVGGTAFGLDVLHKAGVIHRDLKPANILLPDDGGLKICDFGLASLIQDQEVLEVGTARYMAPELFGEEPADHRADLYSLGMIAYEMLAGRERFADVFKIVLKDQRNQALRWMKWHTNLRVKAPPLTQINPQIAPALSDLVARLMEKDPDQRVGSTAELIDAIRRHFSGETPASATSATAAAAAAPIAPEVAAAPTAPLPKKRGKLLVILAGTLVFWSVLGAGLYSLNQNREAQRVHDQAMRDFEQARDHYRANRYEEAVQTFQALAAQWPNDPVLGKGSLARMHLAQAMLHKQAGKSEEALRSLDQADSYRLLDADLIQHERELIERRTGMASALGAVEELIQQGRFAEARRRVQDLRNVSLSEADQAKVAELASRIEDQDERNQIAHVMQEAQQLLKTNQPSQALEVLRQGQQRHSSREIDGLIEQITATMQYEKALADARRAENSGDLARAIEAYQALQRLKNETSTQQKIRQLRGQQAYAEGRRLLAAGSNEAAAAQFKLALTFIENEDARQQLARLEQLDQRASYIRSGDEAARSGNAQVAISHYNNALRLGDDPAIRQKIRSLQIQLKSEEAQNAWNSGNDEQARALFQQLLEMDPGNALAQRGLADLDKRAEYHRLLAAGDARRAQSRFAEATLEYRRAQKVLDTEEVRQRLDDTEYDKLLAAAKADIAAEKWASAKAWLMTAKARRDTEEVRKLLEQVEQYVPSGE